MFVLFQVSSVKGFEEEAKIAYAAILDIEGRTEEAITTLETINNMSSIWHLARVSYVTDFTNQGLLSCCRYPKGRWFREMWIKGHLTNRCLLLNNPSIIWLAHSLDRRLYSCVFYLFSVMYCVSLADLPAPVRGGQQWGGGDPRQVHHFPEKIQDLLV